MHTTGINIPARPASHNVRLPMPSSNPMLRIVATPAMAYCPIVRSKESSVGSPLSQTYQSNYPLPENKGSVRLRKPTYATSKKYVPEDKANCVQIWLDQTMHAISVRRKLVPLKQSHIEDPNSSCRSSMTVCWMRESVSRLSTSESERRSRACSASS